MTEVDRGWQVRMERVEAGGVVVETIVGQPFTFEEALVQRHQLRQWYEDQGWQPEWGTPVWHKDEETLSIFIERPQEP